MENSEQTAMSADMASIAPANTPFDQELKSKLDHAWAKIENGCQQEDEGRRQWIEGTLELANILLDLRQRFPADVEFGKQLTEAGYGENRLSRQDRAALINMGEHPDLARIELEHTHRSSLQNIWKDVQTRLPSPRQPGEDTGSVEPPIVTTDDNLAEVPPPPQPVTPPPPPPPPARVTRRQKKSKPAPPKQKWVTDSKAWADDRVLYFDAACEFLSGQIDEVMEKATDEQREKVGEYWRPEPLLEAMQKLEAKVAEFSEWLNN
jgi:hypothetical protein